VQGSRRDLVEERLEQVMVVFVDHIDICFGTVKGSCGGYPGKSAPNDHDTRCAGIHLISLFSATSCR
jgi:hypothetical protein